MLRLKFSDKGYSLLSSPITSSLDNEEPDNSARKALARIIHMDDKTAKKLLPRHSYE
jgi:hypothetical protein